jgi:hypothetical protein
VGEGGKGGGAQERGAFGIELAEGAVYGSGCGHWGHVRRNHLVEDTLDEIARQYRCVGTER